MESLSDKEYVISEDITVKILDLGSSSSFYNKELVSLSMDDRPSPHPRNQDPSSGF